MGRHPRDFDTALAVWPNYRPLFDNWLMQELVEQGDQAPIWRDRRVPTEDGHVRGDVYSTSRSEIWENFSPQHGRTGSAARVYAERLGAKLFAHISALDKAMNCSLYGANVSHLSPQAWETVPVHPIDTTDRQVGSPILSGQEYLEIFGPC
jgi:hypothetical protein